MKDNSPALKRLVKTFHLLSKQEEAMGISTVAPGILQDLQLSRCMSPRQRLHCSLDCGEKHVGRSNYLAKPVEAVWE